jgi:hypothetical protein
MMAVCSRNKQTLHYSISYFPFPAKPNNLLARFSLMYGCIILHIYLYSSHGDIFMCEDPLHGFPKTKLGKFGKLTLSAQVRPPLIPLWITFSLGKPKRWLPS